jgi:hypothetical protein
VPSKVRSFSVSHSVRGFYHLKRQTEDRPCVRSDALCVPQRGAHLARGSRAPWVAVIDGIVRQGCQGPLEGQRSVVRDEKSEQLTEVLDSRDENPQLGKDSLKVFFGRLDVADIMPPIVSSLDPS